MIEAYDMVKVKRQCDERPFEALVVEVCNKHKIYKVVSHDYSTLLRGGWTIRYITPKSIISPEEN